MANVVVTSTAEYIKAVFNTLATSADIHTGYFRKSAIVDVALAADSSFVTVSMSSDSKARKWVVSYNGSAGTFQVDTVDGATPTSNSDLNDKIGALLKS